MPEQIYTFSDEELARMFKSGEMRVLTAPEIEPVQTLSDHEQALQKAKKLFGPEFEDVYTLRIGGKSAEQLLAELEESRVLVSYYVGEYLKDTGFITLPEPKNIEIVNVRVSDLGFEEPSPMEQIFQKASEFGLNLCPGEVGPHLILNSPNLIVDHWSFFAMEPMVDLDGGSAIWGAGCTGGEELLLDSEAVAIKLGLAFGLKSFFIFSI